MFPCVLLADIFPVSHILLLLHSPNGKLAKYEKLGKYFPYCTRHRVIAATYC